MAASRAFEARDRGGGPERVGPMAKFLSVGHEKATKFDILTGKIDFEGQHRPRWRLTVAELRVGFAGDE